MMCVCTSVSVCPLTTVIKKFVVKKFFRFVLHVSYTITVNVWRVFDIDENTIIQKFCERN